MDTRLKNTRLFSKTGKRLAFVLVMTLAVVLYGSVCGLYWCTDGFENFYNLGESGSADYTQTPGFVAEFERLLDDVVKVNLIYQSEGNIREGGAVNEEELLQGFKTYYNIQDGIITANTEVTPSDEVVIIQVGEIPEELMDNFEEYSELVCTKLKSYPNLYIQGQLDDFNQAKKELDSYHNFLYAIESKDGNPVAGNTAIEDILAQNQYIILNGDFLSNKTNVYIDYTNPVVSEGGYTLYAGIPNRFSSGDNFYNMQEEAGKKQQLFQLCLAMAGGSFLAGLACWAYLLRVAGQDHSGSAVQLGFTDGLYNDLRLILAVVVGVILLNIASFMMNNLNYYDYGSMWMLGWGCALGVLFVLAVLLALDFTCSLSRHLKNHSFLHHTLIATLFRKLVEILNGKSFSGMALVLFVMYTVMVVLAAYTGFLLIPVVLIAAVLLARNLDSLTKIMKTAKQASKGNYVNMDIKTITNTFAPFAMDVNNIQSGLKMAVDEAVKGEKMKTELITNVSHDLKTPLTSIVSYVGLLQREKLDNPQAEQYVAVIAEKSQRLKQLIEDLIEASKVSSGNLTVERTKINLKELVIQACGEFEEKARQIGLEFRISTRGEVMIYADGRHMWRILDNLLSNVMKYAMPKSRVYIHIYQEGRDGVFVIRNVSQDEITVNVENLAERFVRGDSSRTTEGSGLGLSIAKSLVVIQGGTLDLAVEGDLFKVTVRMPLFHQEAMEKDDAEPSSAVGQEEGKKKPLGRTKSWFQQRSQERKERKAIKTLLEKQKKRHQTYLQKQKAQAMDSGLLEEDEQKEAKQE